MDAITSCVILGHHPMRFRWGFDEDDEYCQMLKIVLLQQIQLLHQKGCQTFWVVCDPGVALWSGEIITALQKMGADIILNCVLPYEEVATKWTPDLRKRHFKLLEECSSTSVSNLHQSETSVLDAYRNTIHEADMVLVAYDSSSDYKEDAGLAIQYAIQQKKPVVTINPSNFCIDTYYPREIP